MKNTWYAVIGWVCVGMGSVGSITAFIGLHDERVTPLLWAIIGSILFACHEIRQVNYRDDKP
jgi:hypothetical protein